MSAGNPDPGRQSALNRLSKAAKLGFGPMAGGKDPQEQRRNAPSPDIVRRDNQRWKSMPDVGVLQNQESADDYDFAGFLASGQKKPAVAKRVPPAAREKMTLQTLNISTHVRVDTAPDESTRTPQQEVQTQIAVSSLPEDAKKVASEKPVEEEKPLEDWMVQGMEEALDGEEERLKKKDLRKKREEWRKKRREEKRKEEETNQRERDREQEKERDRDRRRHRDSSSDAKRSSSRSAEKDDPKARAKMWKLLNNDGRIVPKNLGQVSDKDLDKRLEKHKSRSTKSKSRDRSRSRDRARRR